MERYLESVKDLKKMFWALIILVITLLGTSIADLVKSAHAEPSPQVRVQQHSELNY